MKAIYSISLFLFLFVFSACKNYSDEQIINKTIKKLNSIQTIEYVLNYEMTSDIMGQKYEDKMNCYFDFRNNDTLIGAKYIVTFSYENNLGARYFDGKSVISVDDNKKEIIINDNPNFSDVNTNTFMMHSIAKLRKALLLIQNDSAVTFIRLNDTIINNIESYHFNIEMKNKRLGFVNSIIEGDNRNEWTANYKLMIAKSTFLPIQFEEISKAQQIKNTFLQIELNNIKADSVWNCDERYSEKYMRLSSQDWRSRMENRGKAYVSAKAIEFTLQNLQNESVSLSNLRGNNVLLMFWFPGCVGCIPVISVLNDLEGQFVQKGLKIYAVEFMNAKKEAVEKYVKEKRIVYTVLYNGKEVANEYGVLAAPTFYLIDKAGTITYFQIGLNKQELIDNVEKLF